jgi:hypothetical protein
LANRLVLLVLLTTTIQVGCGSKVTELPRIAVTGSVSLNSAPFESGSLLMIPAGGQNAPSASAVIADGQYSIERDSGPIAGRYQVTVSGSPNAQAAGKPGMTEDESEFTIPTQYEVTIEISEDQQRYDIELTTARSNK